MPLTLVVRPFLGIDWPDYPLQVTAFFLVKTFSLGHPKDKVRYLSPMSNPSISVLRYRCYSGVVNVVVDTGCLHNLLRGLHYLPLFATLVCCDNVIDVYLSTNPVQYQHTKHIKINIYFVCDKVAMGQICLLHVFSSS